MKTNGEVITKLEIVEKILHTLCDTFDYNVFTIEESQYHSAMIVDDLQATLEALEQRFNERKTKIVRPALKAQVNLKKDKEIRNTGESNTRGGFSRNKGRGRGRDG